MDTTFILRETNASGLLLPGLFAQTLSVLHKTMPDAPHGAVRGQELRLTLAMKFDDAACAAFVLDFAGQGQRVEAAAHGPSASLLGWAFHAIAAATKGDLLEDNAPITPDPASHHAAALAYLETYEADVRESRKVRIDLTIAAFVAWLVREEHVALADVVAEDAFADFPLDDAPRLYELLLESDAMDDVFISERDLARLLSRFNARALPA